MKRYLFTLTIMVFLCLVSQTASAKLFVWGYVNETGSNGSKIAGVTVRVQGKQIFNGKETTVYFDTMTDSSGLYSFQLGGESIPPLSICVSKEGYVKPNGSSAENCFNLMMETGTIDVHFYLKKR